MKLTKNTVSAFIFPFAASALFLASTALGDVNTKSETTTSDNHTSNVGFGFHGGMNSSDFNYTSSTMTQAKSNVNGTLIGFHMQSVNMGFVGLRVEANYSVKGYDIANVATVYHHYLQIPLLVKIAPISGPIEVYAEAGPAAAFHLSSTVEAANASVSYNDNSNNVDFSLIGGVGVGFKVDPILLEIEGRYDYGLTNLNNSNTVQVNSRALQLLAGVTFLM